VRRVRRRLRAELATWVAVPFPKEDTERVTLNDLNVLREIVGCQHVAAIESDSVPNWIRHLANHARRLKAR